MEGKYRESKEEIKDRMIRTALDFWNIKNVENLDPFIRLLIEALAMQLHLVSEDIADIELRTMRRLSEVLLPQAYTVARPAHALVYVPPLQDGVNIDFYSGFSSADSAKGRGEGSRSTFYPVCRMPLHRASVQMMTVEGDLYSVLPDLSKKLLSRGEICPESVGKVFLGIDFEDDTLDLCGLSFFVEFPNVDQRKEYLSQLTYCEWRLEGRKLNCQKGIVGSADSSDVGVRLMGDESISERANQQAMDFYVPNFMTIRDDVRVDRSQMSLRPKQLESCGSFDGSCKKALLWLEVSFPSKFPSSVLSDIQILLNVVPMVNKELHSITSLMKKNFGVLPLPLSSCESFLDMVSVEDENGVVYQANGTTVGGEAFGTYSLRQGGCESFDKRDAKDYLLRLQHLLEDEMALFSASEIGRNTENRYLIDSLIAKIGCVSKHTDTDAEALHYLFVDPPQENTLFYVKYWTTYGAMANGLRVGTRLNPKEDLFGEVGQAVLVSLSSGGAGVPTERERIAQFKYILGSHDRIVTANDIENFCWAELTDMLREVYVKKGVQASNSPNEGLIRTIDVHLVLAERVEASQRNSMADRIYDGLVARSPMTFNYRILVD